MKRLLAFIIASLILLGTAGCGKVSDKASLDIDLTKMSSTMVFGEVYSMMTLPDDYAGKTVKMKGTISVYHGADGDTYSCMIADASQCCQQGISFTLSEGYAYPPEGTEITVTGIFDLASEEDYQYGTIRNAKCDKYI